MAVYFYLNGQQSSQLPGYVASAYYGYRQNAVYSFTVPSTGCSKIHISVTGLSLVSESQYRLAVGAKIGTYPSQYASANENTTVDAVFTPQEVPYTGTYRIDGDITKNLTGGTYYVTFYLPYNLMCSWQGWDTSDFTGMITTSGSYTPTVPEIDYISTSCTTNVQNALQIRIKNGGGKSFTAKFKYGSTLLATSESFLTSLGYTCPRSWFTYNTTATSMTINVEVYDGSTQIGAGSFTLNADSDMRPTVDLTDPTAFSFTLIDAIDQHTPIATKTTVSVYLNRSKVNLSTCAGATIDRWFVVCNGDKYETPIPGDPETIVAGPINGDGYVTLYVYDTRERWGGVQIYYHVVPYVGPIITSAEVKRCESTSPYDEDQEGPAFKVKISTSCTDTGTNTTVTNVYYREIGDEEYTLAGQVTNAEEGSWKVFNVGLNSQKMYTIKLVVLDSLSGSNEYEFELSFEDWLICFPPGGKAAAVGMAAPENANNQLVIPAGWEFVTGSTRFGGNRFVLSNNLFGTSPPDTGLLSSPVEGQLYFYITDSEKIVPCIYHQGEWVYSEE